MSEGLHLNPEVEMWLENPFREITHGFPITQATELAEIYQGLLRRGVTRMPIMGTEDGRVFLLSSAGQNDHETLLRHLHQNFGYTQTDLTFTTSLEALTREVPQRPYLLLRLPSRPLYIRIGQGSDRLPTPLGNQDLKPLFESDTIEVVR